MTARGQDVWMSFMDVEPTGGGNGKGVVLLLHGKNFYGSYWENTIRALTASSSISGGTRQSTVTAAREGMTLSFSDALAIVGTSVTPSIGSAR